MVSVRDPALAQIPSAWAQAFPRAVRLAPEGLLVPAATLRVLVRRGGPIELLTTGFTFEPWLVDGDRVRVDPAAAPRPGDVALCEAEGWGDLRRVLGRTGEGALITGIDTIAHAREIVPPTRVLGIARGLKGAGDWRGRLVARFFPAWSRFAGFLYWRRKVLEAPSFGESARRSVQEKYAQQVEGYAARSGGAIDSDILEAASRRLEPGASILIIGCGAGGELIRLASAGYGACGVDFVPAMLEASRRNARAAGIDAELFQQDMVDMDLPGHRFAAIFVTPDVYAFVDRREHRIGALRRLGTHLRPGGFILFSAHLLRRSARRLEVTLAWLRHRSRGAGNELGDWYNWFLTPGGTIGKSFLHLATVRQVLAEARAAGYARVERVGRAHFIADRFAV